VDVSVEDLGGGHGCRRRRRATAGLAVHEGEDGGVGEPEADVQVPARPQVLDRVVGELPADLAAAIPDP